MLYAYLAVASDDLTLAELEASLGPSAKRGERGARGAPGTPGIGGHTIGDVGLSGYPAVDSCWEHPVVRRDEHLEGIDFSPAVAALGEQLARAIGGLVAEGAWARLVVVQEMHGTRRDGADQGFGLDRDAVAWLALARAEVDVDQYVHPLAWWQSLARAVADRASHLRWAVWRRLRSSARTTCD